MRRIFRAFPPQMFSGRSCRCCKFISSITKRRDGVKRVSCEVRPGENNENKYVPRALVQRARSPLASRRAARVTRLLHRDWFYKERKCVFFPPLLPSSLPPPPEERGANVSTEPRAESAHMMPRVIVDGTIITFFFPAPLPFSRSIARTVSRVTRQESSEWQSLIKGPGRAVWCLMHARSRVFQRSAAAGAAEFGYAIELEFR